MSKYMIHLVLIVLRGEGKVRAVGTAEWARQVVGGERGCVLVYQ